MVKKFLLMVILLAGTALTLVFGDVFELPFIEEPPAATASFTAQPTATIQATSTASTEPTATTEATATPEQSTTDLPTPTITSTPLPTLTATATASPTATSSPTATEEIFNELFEVQTGSPVYVTNFVHPQAACNWQGVAGQVFTRQGLPLVGYVVRVSGVYNGQPVNLLGLTGLVENTPYGPGSFELVLGSQALDTQDVLYIQLFEPSGTEVSAPVGLTTYSSCSKNLLIINFVEK